MDVVELRCPRCGAPISSDKNICDYCNTQYVIIAKLKAFSFGNFVECNNFQRLQALINNLASFKKSFIGNDAEPLRRLLEACRFCHVKNCPFFNQDLYDVLNTFLPTKRTWMTDEEFEEAMKRVREWYANKYSKK